MKEKENSEKTCFKSIDDAVKELGLSKRVRWKIYLGYLCRYTKKSICPEFVVNGGVPVSIAVNNQHHERERE